MKIGFIGTGNMATSIIRGMIAAGHTGADDIYCADPLEEKRNRFARENGVHACASNEELIAAVDMVVLAVKPYIVPKVLAASAAQLRERGSLLVSIAVEVPLAALQEMVGSDTAIIRVLPNVNAAVRAGAAVVCHNAQATREQVAYVLGMFRSIGTAILLDEKDFPNFSIIGGATPAFTYLFIDALSRAGVKHGMSKDVATQIVAQAVLGSAKMVLETGENPWALVDKVCSPGGSTVAGICSLEEDAFIGALIRCVDAAMRRSAEMGRESAKAADAAKKPQ